MSTMFPPIVPFPPLNNDGRDASNGFPAIEPEHFPNAAPIWGINMNDQIPDIQVPPYSTAIGPMPIAPDAPAWLVGDGAAHPVGTGLVRSFSVGCPGSDTDTPNQADVFFGDSTLTVDKGAPVPPGGGLDFPAIPDCSYDLSQHFYLAQTGDKVILLCEN
jgi:hypothetical protein